MSVCVCVCVCVFVCVCVCVCDVDAFGRYFKSNLPTLAVNAPWHVHTVMCLYLIVTERLYIST